MDLAIGKKIFQKLFVFQFLALGLIGGCSQEIEGKTSGDRHDSTSPELIFSAAASMQDVLEEIKQLYLVQYPQAKITFNFGSSGSLQHQIEQGAPIDIFISAAPQQMNDLAAKKLLLNETRQDLVKNQMVLVTPEDNHSIDSFDDLIKKSIEQVALGEPNSVPAGKYAQEILTSLNLIDRIKTKAVYAKDVRQVLNYVATGNIEAGIVYRTDTAKTKNVRVVATAPPTIHSPLIYPVAIMKDSNHPEAAKQMLDFLFTSQAQAIFKKHGFISVSK
ncbi:molybdate ABC transporter substrate-binding protein [Waterburya agarophytonicola K14]|uniref:Molybdate ABC transporter substrate-binding protein n=1 Tax=Waterburya agarophytonicola KI4 TaxID=2874699 RepID=A0A964BWC6_9CYAN|nr:molybdate ABC transporter substrate-binding protein [Waterburya agarophytonicola]MCC0178996.1 molybdate ABC transporter substrate-binding protein [Waterburya agarophytonicola KI4]